MRCLHGFNGLLALQLHLAFLQNADDLHLSAPKFVYLANERLVFILSVCLLGPPRAIDRAF